MAIGVTEEGDAELLATPHDLGGAEGVLGLLGRVVTGAMARVVADVVYSVNVCHLNYYSLFQELIEFDSVSVIIE